jgi:hypothetical protein
MSWKIEGTYFEACNCESACPCVFLSKPSEGHCNALVAWHIDRGEFEKVKLDGLNVVLAVHSPGNMAESKWDVAVYLDAKADAAQKDALTKIFAGQAGGHPSKLAAHVGKILGVASVPIQYSAKGKERSLTIPGIAETAIEGVEGQGGGEITIRNHPLAIAPGEPAVAAKSKRFDYRDHGLHWEVSSRNGFYSPFQYAA